MPRLGHFPPVALAAAVDLRTRTGDLFYRDDSETPVNGASLGGAGGLFRDIIEAVCGRGSRVGMNTELKALWEAAGGDPSEVSVTLDGSTDRLQVSNTAAVDLVIPASTGNAVFGLPTAELTIAPDAVYVASDWRRGLVSSGLTVAPPRLSIQRGMTIESASPAWHTDLVTYLRGRGVEGDIADERATTCIEALDLAVHGHSSQIRWGVTDDGRVYWTQPYIGAGAGAGTEITWLDTHLRDELGFSGDEAVGQTGDQDGDVYYQIADYPAPSLVVSEWGIEGDDRSYVSHGRETRTTRGGEMSVRAWRDDHKDQLKLRVDGPADGGFDLHAHLLDRVAPRLARRPVLWLARDWGDCRRSIARGEYSLFETPDRGGYRGWLPLQIEGEVDISPIWDDDLLSGALISLDVRRAPAAS